MRAVRTVRALRPLSRTFPPITPDTHKPKRAPRRDLRDGYEPGEPVLLLTVEQARARLQCGRRGIYQLINSGRLASVKIGGARRIPVSGLDDFIAAIRASSRQPLRLA